MVHKEKAAVVLFDKQTYQFIIEFVIRLIPHGKVEKCFLVHHAFFFVLCIKPAFAVIRAHAAFPHAAKAHAAGGEMDQGIIDASSSELYAFRYITDVLFAGGKQVKCQRGSHGVDLVSGFGQAVIGEHG